MLFISILLSVWFVLWLAYAIFIKDTAKLFVSWLDEMYDEEEPEGIDDIIDNSPTKGAYHLSCNKCNYDWWTTESNVNFCPNCGKKQHE